MDRTNRILELFASDLEAYTWQKEWLSRHQLLIGDLHNHCGISYGHGKLENAIEFAKQQLDFFSVTGHFAWPDMIETEGITIPQEVVAYHKAGFSRLRKGWNEYKQLMIGSETTPNSVVAFLSYEYHSFLYGDYTIVMKDPVAELPDEAVSGQMDDRLGRLLQSCVASTDGTICMPHHIGYREGYRGISWSHFNPNASPLVEIVSMHGCAENHRSQMNYLHTMGPRTGNNTMQGGLAAGYRFGITGSTDHHNASPGSYGCGRTGVWSMGKDREHIWLSLCDRMTCALTGDPIEAVLFVNDMPIGSEYSTGLPVQSCRIDAYVVGCDALERVEVLRNNQVIARLFPVDILDSIPRFEFEQGSYKRGRIGFAFGWGEKNVRCNWDVTVSIMGGDLCVANPRLRGEDIVDPLDLPSSAGQDAKMFRRARFLADIDSQRVYFTASTSGNPTATTNTTQGFSLEVLGDAETLIIVEVQALFKNKHIHRIYRYGLSDIVRNPVSEYIDGFVSPAISISRFIPIEACIAQYHAEILDVPSDPDVKSPWYYLRAFQSNGDAVWTSPIDAIVLT